MICYVKRTICIHAHTQTHTHIYLLPTCLGKDNKKLKIVDKTEAQRWEGILHLLYTFSPI